MKKLEQILYQDWTPEIKELSEYLCKGDNLHIPTNDIPDDVYYTVHEEYCNQTYHPIYVISFFTIK